MLQPSRSGPKVWDPLVRLVHWSMVASVAVAWLVIDRDIHDAAGYALLALVATRIAWGFVGPEHARFSDFVRRPASVLLYVKQMLRGREPRYVGHNPLGGWMVVILLVFVAGAAITGLLGGFWRGLHGFFGNLLIFLVLLHIVGVVVDTLLTRDNIVRAMITGRKKVDEAAAAREPPLVGWWRALILALVIAAGGGYLYAQIDWAGLAAERQRGGEE